MDVPDQFHLPCLCRNGFMSFRCAGPKAKRPGKYYYICPKQIKHEHWFIWADRIEDNEYCGFGKYLTTYNQLKQTLGGSEKMDVPGFCLPCLCRKGFMLFRCAGPNAQRPGKYYYICPEEKKHKHWLIWADLIFGDQYRAFRNYLIPFNELKQIEGSDAKGSDIVGSSKVVDRHLPPNRSRSDLRTLMYLAALRGDWQAAEVALQEYPDLLNERITETGDRALHVAAATKRTKFVRKLVRKMNAEDLLLENDYGNTAFMYAAASGIVKIAAVMREKNQSLVTCRGTGRETPIYRAALFGNADMVSYLFEFTFSGNLSADERFDLLLATIERKLYDVALKILRNDKSLATKTKGNKTALHLLAEHDMSDISTCREAFLKSLVCMFAPIPCLSGMKRICEQPLMRKSALLLAKELWDEIQLLDEIHEPNLFHLLLTESPILHDAAKVGNVEFITMLTRSNPNLIFENDMEGHTIFHIAVKHRQENVFSLIHEMGALKDWIAVSQTNEKENNILHLAGELAPPNRLRIVAGAALQMQRELMWYKEVKEIVPSFCQTKKNKEGKLATELFSPNHEQLLKEGENWLKETANSCMITATLTATVVYAAAFTVPGGTDGNTGTPILLGRGWFRVFMVADAAAMFFSTFSIIMFLAILTSRFQEDDFLVSLPRKLLLGLTTLFASIICTIFAFTATCFLLFTEERAWIPTSVAAVACLSLTILFIRVHLKLWVDTFRTTYLSRSLFHQSKHSLYEKSDATYI